VVPPVPETGLYIYWLSIS